MESEDESLSGTGEGEVSLSGTGEGEVSSQNNDEVTLAPLESQDESMIIDALK